LPASTKPIEGISDLQSYWFYLAASGILSLVIDTKIALFFWRMKKAKRPNQIITAQRASRVAD
jgi:hypothetical protein